MTSAKDKLSKIENLLRDADGNDFRLVESRARYFCPFEAIGMVRQEIRHSSFLAYMLDPARPHGLSDTLLRALVVLLLDKSRRTIDVHSRPMTAARVFRERQNMDVLIEIPPESDSPGIVIVLELKIDATERSNQLGDYQQRARAAYPAGKWEHLFGFITKNGDDANSAGDSHDWVSLSWTDLINTFESAISCHSAPGRGIELFRDYAKMMKRHDIAKGDADPDLSEAIRNIWARHKEALDYLIEHRPDALGDLKQLLSNNKSYILNHLQDKARLPVDADQNSKQILRYCFRDLLVSFPDLGKGGHRWVRSGSILLIQIDMRGEKITAEIAMGPADGANDFKLVLADKLKQIDSNGAHQRSDAPWLQFFQKTIVEGQDGAIELTKNRSEKALLDHVIEQIADHLNKIYPKVAQAVEQASNRPDPIRQMS